MDSDCENEIAHHLRGSAAPAQPTVVWACQLRKDDDFDGAFMFMCKCFSRRGWVSMMVSCNCPVPTRHLRFAGFVALLVSCMSQLRRS